VGAATTVSLAWRTPAVVAVKDVLLLLALVLAAWAFMTYGATAMALDEERAARVKSELRAITLATQVAYWKPTPAPCRPYHGTGSWC
jgi:hypothetical protein